MVGGVILRKAVEEPIIHSPERVVAQHEERQIPKG
jgi:hypothetical protein